MNLKSTIVELINSKKEGDYWDFKESQHNNKAELLHDILCFANNPIKRDKFIIIGVADPPETEIIGVKDFPARKKQHHYLDWLRTINFAGHIRPEIEVETIFVDGKELDVIIIKDRPLKPYWITEDVKGTKDGQNKTVFSSHIYSRVGDTNTPIDKSADLYWVEKMWEERFGLDMSPLMRMKTYLRESKSWENKKENNYYYSQFPEFRIEMKNLTRFSSYEHFCYFFSNHDAFVGNAYFFYHSTLLFELAYITLDEMRLKLPDPEWGSILIDGGQHFYNYYFEESEKGLFLNFLSTGENSFSSRGGDANFLLFKNEDERRMFNDFCLLNLPNWSQEIYSSNTPGDRNIPYMKDAIAFRERYEEFLRERTM